jgi:hypothetical protein
LNQIKWDNHVSNLEWSMPREQSTHRFMNENKTSKYTGVSWAKASGKFGRWCAQIQINRKKYMLGYFETETEARDAYLNALEENKLENKYALKV